MLRGCLEYRVFCGAAFTTRLPFQHAAFSAFHSIAAGYFSATGPENTPFASVDRHIDATGRAGAIGRDAENILANRDPGWRLTLAAR